MAEPIKRTRTRYPGVYFNEKTKRYDVKYNYTVPDPRSGKSVHRAKWSYGQPTLASAQAALARLRLAEVPTAAEDITLRGALALWRVRAETQHYSVTTVRNTECYVKMLEPFLPADLKLSDVTEELYYRLFADLRAHGYAEETIHTLNATFKKLMAISCKRGFLRENVLRRADPVRTRRKETVRILTGEEWRRIDGCLTRSQPRLRLLYNLLYYTGLRIGECLALTWSDFHPGGGAVWLHVDKSLLATGQLKEPKNFKHRAIPLPGAAERLYRQYKVPGPGDQRVFPVSAGWCLRKIKQICREAAVEPCTCHDFRHTFISNLIRSNVPLPVVEQVSGDTQQTIFQRYSHMFEGDRLLVRAAFE